jgi:HD-GYP domain-containing protein (c-di-GMP phosphodiesterase class II)/CHASE2 domain-containing sensor protein
VESSPRPKRRRTILLCGITPVIVTVCFAITRPASFARLDAGVYDTVLRSVSTRPISNRVVIVDVDERSLSEVGQWPWRRDVIGELIGRLRGLGASTVALDIVFAESDRYDELGERVVRSSDSHRVAPDERLARTLRDGRVILGYAMTFDRDRPMRTQCVLHPVGLALVHSPGETDSTPFFRATGAVCALPILAQAAGASGFLNAAPDADGILRRVPLFVELEGRVYPGLALAAVAAATGARHMALHVSTANDGTLSLDDRTIPVDGKSNLLLRYRGRKKTFPYVSAADVMSGQVSAETFRDKIVLVGTTALGTREVVATPLDTLFAGVEVQATVADNLLAQDFVSRSQFSTVLESQIVLGAGIALAVLILKMGLVAGVVGAGGLVVAFWCGSIWLLSANGLFVSPLFPTLGTMLSLATLTFGKFAVERRRAESADRDKASAQNLMVQALLSLTETRDAETGSHSRRTQEYARLLAEQLSMQSEFSGYLTTERIDLLSSLAPLHDIGKVGIPDHILNKPGALTPAELAEMRRHPVLGLEVILKAEKQAGVRDDAIMAMAKDIVYTHHERWDGSGYPQGLRGPMIPIAGRVMALVDVYDATSTRTLYRPSRSHADTVEFIRSGRGTHFDPAVVDAFERVAAQFEHVAAETDLAPAKSIASRIPVRRDVPSAPLTAQTAAEQP